MILGTASTKYTRSGTWVSNLSQNVQYGALTSGRPVPYNLPNRMFAFAPSTPTPACVAPAFCQSGVNPKPSPLLLIKVLIAP